ncbi:TetR/AcrR family transcriptional regulator [Nocardioides panacisoli]|uniref:TetR/AcrR family transcriptional regulator n=1 Tax=Nocardioides panacisoli TaxID=627624 RepID=UPI001C630282|nr:TetR/AcrR family transcriptional regulator [Nocardioides panacisoli]QYJ03516.1 TetR/AcrR family transcriptional regulator [Nocardioides panacisoli]
MSAPVDGSTLPKDDAADVSARERILSAAFTLFQESGYEGTAMTRIARDAGMTPAAIYWHFPSKQDLLAGMLKRMYERSYAELRASVRSDGTATQRLSDYVRAYIRIQLEELGDRRNHSYATLASSLTEDGQRELGRLSRPYIELLREILRQGSDRGEFDVEDVSTTSYAIETMCEYVFTWFRTGGRLTVDEVGEKHLELVLRMLCASPPDPEHS